MSNFLHGLGGGIGRGIGRFIAILIIAFLIYFVVNLLDLDIKNDVLNRILMLNVHASDLHYDVTNYVYTNTAYCNSNQKGLCVADTSSTTYSRYTFGTTSYQNTVAIDFMLNYTIPANVNATIRLTGKNWANVSYSCSGTAYMTNCRVVRASSTILNINFTSIANGVGGESFHIYANGNVLNTNDTFYVQKADFYATYINSSDATNQDVINNQNQNTEDLINNNNQNTQDIIQQVQDLIANDEELTNKLLEAQTCPTGPLLLTRDEWGLINNKYLNSSGTETSNNDYSISPWIMIKKNTPYSLSNTTTSNNVYYCVYTETKVVISCSPLNSTSISFTTPSNAAYFRVSLGGNRSIALTGPVCNDWQKEAQDRLNNFLEDDSIDQSQANSFFNDFQDNDHGLSGIVTLPLTTIQSLTSQQCIALQLPVPFTNGHFTLPCMSEIYQSKVPGLYNLWQVVCYGLIGYWIATDIFKLVKGFKDPEQDKVEVMDL